MVGVVGFYFVIGAITSIISNSIAKHTAFNNHINSLRKLKKKHGISENLYCIALQSILRKDYKRKRENFADFIAKFPKTLKTELKHQMYRSIFRRIGLAAKLSAKNLIAVGDCIRQVRVRKSSLTRPLCLPQTSAARQSLLCQRGRRGHDLGRAPKRARCHL